MPVQAMYGYRATPRDLQENFHGSQLVYIGWDQHLMFCSPVCLPLPPFMPFGVLVKDVLPEIYASHPDWTHVEWNSVEWIVDGKTFAPDMGASLADQGIGHKSLIRFRTPGLNGIGGAAS